MTNQKRIPVPILVRPLIGAAAGALGLVVVAVAAVVVIVSLVMFTVICITLPITAIFLDELNIDGKKVTFTRGKK